MSLLRILVADDHEVVRRGVRALLEAEPGWIVCGEAANGREALAKARQLKPDVVVLDIAMPDVDGLEVTRRIRKEQPETEVLILTMHDPRPVLREALRSGARGCVLKSDAGKSLIAGVESVRRRQPFFTAPVADVVLDAYLQHLGGTGDRDAAGGDRLTPREEEVALLLADGKSSKEVATLLGISTKTVDTHRARVMRKLGVHSIVDLVRHLIRTGRVRP